jgi:hypothetical protein
VTSDALLAGIGCLAAVVVLATSSTARAYRTAADDLGLPPPVVQRGTTVELVVRGGAPFGVDDLAGDVHAAASSWRLSCSAIELIPIGSTAEAADETDRRTTIETIFAGWELRGYSPAQAAITEVRYEETSYGWVIADADIFLNGETIDWSGPDAPDSRAVLLHELGHVLGLAHPCSHAPVVDEPICAPGLAADSIMYPDYQDRAWAPRPDDREGICALYPRAACPERPCAPDETCEAGLCVQLCASGESCAAGVCAEGGDLAGMCVPRASEGAPCAVGDECQSLLCLTSMRAGSYCTRACITDAECARSQTCLAVDGRRVCAPPPPSCSATRARLDAGAREWTLLLAGLVVARLRATRRREEDHR